MRKIINSVKYIVESLRDITAVKHLEKKYTDVRELIDKVVQSSVSAIIAADKNGRIILMNEAAQALFGYSNEEIDKVNIENFYPPGVAREIMRKLRDKTLGERGKLEIVTRQHSNFIEILFKDTGAGIPPESMKRIFDPFFTTKEVGKGTGLGLSICYGIIMDHKGQIKVTETGPEGTTFRIRLPIGE